MPRNQNAPAIDDAVLLQACFGSGDEGRRAFETCATCDSREIGDAASRLLPLLFRRWGRSYDNSLTQLAHKTYLTVWRQNRQRWEEIASLAAEFGKAGIEFMLLKGAALMLRHYGGHGLRSMGDFDLLIHPECAGRAVRILIEKGWRGEEGATAESILRQSRVRHAWQFLKEAAVQKTPRGSAAIDEQNCDLHWRPLARCYHPAVAEMFWTSAETVRVDGVPVKVPCPTDQFFHVSVHAMHWEWRRNLYWVADAMTILADTEIDWERARLLAAKSDMRVRFRLALAQLVRYFPSAIPSYAIPERLHDAREWEEREYRLLQKPCPLGFIDSAAWHAYNYRRLRPFDPAWCGKPVWLGFPQYLAVFLDVSNPLDFAAQLWKQGKARGRRADHIPE